MTIRKWVQLASLGVAAVLSGCAATSDRTLDNTQFRFVLEGYGEYTPERSRLIIDYSDPKYGQHHKAGGGVLLTHVGDSVEAELGQSFGILYTVKRPSGDQRLIPVEKEIIFPTMTNPSTGASFNSYSSTSRLKPKKNNYIYIHGFHFDEPWEMVPGDWTFRVRYDGETVLEKVITVTRSTGD